MKKAYSSDGFNDHGFNLQQTPQTQEQQLQCALPIENLPQGSQFDGFENSVFGLPQENSSTIFNNNWANNAFALRSQLEKERKNIDTFLELQENRIQKMRLAMQQEMQQTEALMRETEVRVVLLLNQKDEEIARLNKRTLELEEFKRRIMVETQAWKKIAAVSADIIMTLNEIIDQLKEKNEAIIMASNGVPLGFGGADDEISRCASNWPVEKKATGVELGENNGCKKTTMLCVICDSFISCASFLNGRHLSLCEECAAFADAC